MEVRELEAFLAVARELHFARAAESLTITQPALSRRIQALEREFGLPLFVRDRRTVELTVVGQSLVAPAQEALAALQRVSSIASSAGQGEIGRVRIAYAGSSSQTMVAELAHTASDRLPGLTVELLSANFALPALNKVVRGEVDVAFGRWNDVPAGISTRVIAVESLVVAMPANHPASAQDEVRMSDLSHERWITLPSTLGSVLIGHLRRLAAAAGFVPEVVQEGPDTWALIALVEAGVGCTLTLSSVAENGTNNRVVFRPVVDSVPVEVRMAWREDSDNAALRSLLRLTDELLPTLSAT